MLGDRLVVGRRVLAPLTEVQILVPQPFRLRIEIFRLAGLWRLDTLLLPIHDKEITLWLFKNRTSKRSIPLKLPFFNIDPLQSLYSFNYGPNRLIGTIFICDAALMVCQRGLSNFGNASFCFFLINFRALAAAAFTFSG